MIHHKKTILFIQTCQYLCELIDIGLSPKQIVIKIKNENNVILTHKHPHPIIKLLINISPSNLPINYFYIKTIPNTKKFLTQLASYYQTKINIQKKLASSLIYPCCLIVSIIITSSIYKIPMS